MSDVNIREISLQILMDVLEKDVFLHIELRRALDKYDYLERSQKAFIRRLCAGCVERLVELDAVLDHFSKVPVKKQKPLIRTILRMSMYQIMYMRSVPDSAVCNEAVKLTKKHRFTQLSGFVNGVLRTAAREYKTIELPERVRYSMPEELYKLFKAQYPDQYREIFEAFLNHSEKGTIIRINRSRLTEPEETYAARICAEPVCMETGSYRLTGLEGTASVQGFDEGFFTVQDTSSALAAWLASPRPGDRCLDLCAAPGGKTVQLLDLCGDEAVVISRDLSEAKLPMIQENVERCGFSSVQIECADASVFYEQDEEQFDVVLADVPCSGLGVIGTKPDIKYHVTGETFGSLEALQRQILKNALRYVKPGGTLVYSTCTLNRGENQEQVRWLTEQGGCRLIDIQKQIPKEFSDDYKEKGMLTLLPRTGVNEGFFIAVMRKEQNA
jgi:16S rRNA (cytosine967-C5)-methyltransferase